MLMRFVSICVLFTSVVAFSGETAKPAKPVKKSGDKKAVEMDYGPCFAITVGASKDNIAYKGILIPLNKEKTQNILFDTELLRITAAWTGGYLNWASRPFADNNNDYCTVDGDIQFATSKLPGWAKDGKLEDPRNPKDGPLPANWAKYKGLYLNGDKVVISYTVGEMTVLETYAAETLEGETAFTRTIQVGASQLPSKLFLFEVADAEPQPPARKNTGLSVAIKSKEGVYTVGQLVGTPDGVNVDSEEGTPNTRAVLSIAAHPSTLTFKVLLAKTKVIEKLGLFAKKEEAVDLATLTKGGPARWTQEVTTKGVLAKDDVPYVVDMVTAPEDNPYKSWLRFTGLDFFADGRAALCTWNGDVWIVSGIDEKLENLKWKRFATGLNNPMGVKIVDGVVHTIGRDQITKLHDLNNDGEADFYENINNDCFLTTNFHEMCFDLQTDKEGNFYYAKGSSIWAGEQRMPPHNGSIIKVSKDGSKFEVLCSGLRAPNGIAVGPNDEITVADNQGNWIPECPINLITKGGYYGWVGKDQKAEQFKTPDKPLCWIPYNMDKSTSGQVWVPKENAKWGPFAGKMLAASYDCWLSEVFFDKVGDETQGGTFRFPVKFASGMMRPRFNPIDGQLYVAGLKGWSSSAARDCALQRVRYTGKTVAMPVEAHISKTGMEVTFSTALDTASVADKQDSSAEWFNVVRTAAYGSPEYSVSDPKKKAREPIEITNVALKEDGKTVVFTIPTLKPVTNLVIKYKFKTADGMEVKGEVDYTINKVP